MNYSNRVRVLAGLLGASLLGGAGGGGLACGAEKPVLVHYMPWFVAKPYSPDWGYHWTMNSCNPAVTNESGCREIASHFHPLIGPYDSADPMVLEYHVLLMKLAGIDGVVVDWYGMDDVHDFAINDHRTRALLGYIRKAGLQVSLCYEDWTIQAAIDEGLISSTEAISHAQQTLLYAQGNYFNDPCYLRTPFHHPVLLNFGCRYFSSSSEWAAVFSVLEPTNVPSFFTLNSRLAVGAGAFNWPPMHLSQTNDGILGPQVLERYLAEFERSGEGWPAYVSSAFPRFHDYYQQAGTGPSYGFLDDAGGATFRATLARAMTNDSAMVQLVTWNDYGEGTIIEPTLELGFRDLGVVQDCRRAFMDAGFAHRTNDLQLAVRLYNLRRENVGNPALAAELDRIFDNIVTNGLESAERDLTAMESGQSASSNEDASHARLDGSVNGLALPFDTEGQMLFSPSSSEALSIR